MNRLALAVALALAFPLGSLACAGGRKQSGPAPKLDRGGRPWKEAIAVPAWVERVPEGGNGKLVAVGYSQPSFWPQDAINAAADEARGKLALALASHIEVLGMDRATGQGSRGVMIDKEATDVVMQNSRIEATWTDENGERSDPGGVWTLAMLEMDSVRGKSAAEAQLGGSRTANGPAWLDRLPVAEAELYAAGYSAPTYHADE